MQQKTAKQPKRTNMSEKETRQPILPERTKKDQYNQKGLSQSKRTHTTKKVKQIPYISQKYNTIKTTHYNQ